MIIFKKIRWKNFLSTGNVFSEVDLTSARTNLIVGTNGAGKSTILDALTFSLFGKPFRKINKPMLVNSINEKDCLTEIEFSIGKLDYKVIRGIKPKAYEFYGGKVFILVKKNREVYLFKGSDGEKLAKGISQEEFKNISIANNWDDIKNFLSNN